MSRNRLTIGLSSISRESIMEQLTAKLSAKSVAEVTLKNYRQAWKYFNDWYTGDMEAINNQVVINWVNHLKAQALTPTTVNTYLRHLKVILKHMSDEGYIQPIKVSRLKQQDSIKETYSKEELTKLLVRPSKKNCKFVDYRNWVIVNTFVSTGIRRSTLINLRVKDIDFDSALMNLSHTKNRKAQLVPISSTLLGILKEYVLLVKLQPDSFLFPDAYGNQLKPERICNIIVSYNHSRGVQRTSLHAFRHTYAKLMILNGCDIVRLQALLGHASIEQTKVYVDLYGTDLKQGYDAMNPLTTLSLSRQKICI